MPKRILPIFAALALAIAGGAAHAQQWNTTTMPMGNGWYNYQATGPNGQTATGSTMPMGNGWSSTNWTDSYGNTTHCTTMPMGNGWASTSCR